MHSHLLSVSLAFLLTATSLHPQPSGGSGMDPSLGLAFPLELRDNSVILARPIAIAPSRILPAGTILRNAFRLPERADIKRATQGRQSSELEKTYGGRRTGISALEADTRTELERTLDFMAKESVWSETRRFAAMFHALPTEQYFLTIQSTPEATPEPLQLTFPLDLLMTQENGAIRVLAIRLDSPAARAGITPGTTITAIGSTPTQGSLETLLRALPRERRQAQDTTGQLILTLQDNPDSPPRTAALRLPRSLTNPNDFFSDLTADPTPPPPSTSTPPPAAP